MRNPVSKLIGGLIGQTSSAIAGLQSYEVTLNITTVSAASLTGELNGLKASQNTFNAARTELSVRRNGFHSQVAEGVDFATLARDVLKARLGKKHSALWIEVGFLTSLAVPRDPETLLPLLSALAAHLTAHPERENAALDILAERARTLITNINSAGAAFNAQKTAVAAAKSARAQKVRTISRLLRALLTELSLRMDGMDERYFAFGFNRPAQVVTPDVPEKVTVVLTSNGAAEVTWEKAARAKHYRLWKRVVGVDQEMIPAGSPKDPDFTFEHLPANAVVEFAVSAVNPGGESALSQVVSITIT